MDASAGAGPGSAARANGTTSSRAERRVNVGPIRERNARVRGATCWLGIAAIFFALTAAAAPTRSVAIYCSHDPDACELAAQTFSRETGIAATITRKPTGEAYAQIRAERDNPKADVWYGGTFDPFLQGAAEGLFAAYKSPALDGLYPWARIEAERTDYRVVAIYRIIIAFGTNASVLAKRNVPAPRCWSDLAKPEYRGELEMANAVTSGTGYTILATLITLYGEDGAFAYLARLRPNVVRYTQSGVAQGPSVARGEVGVGITFVNEFITQQLAGFPVDIAIPCEGTGDALGGMAIIANGPNPAEARAFYDWALTKGAQELANRTRNLILPSNRSAEVRPEAARYANARTLEIDPANFGAPAERKRLLARWQKEIGDAVR